MCEESRRRCPPPHVGAASVYRGEGTAQRAEGGRLPLRGDIPFRFLRKRMNTKPSHGPIHFRAPASIFWCTVRGMIPHKTKCGAAALTRLRAYGVSLHHMTRSRGWSSLMLSRVLRLQQGHKYCYLGHWSSEVGWNHYDTIRELEKKRKERSQVFYERRKQLNKLRVKAVKVVEEKLGSQMDILASVKY